MKLLLTASLILCLYLGGQSLAQDAAPTAIRVTE